MSKLSDLCLAWKEGEWNQDFENDFNSTLRKETNVTTLVQTATDYTPYSKVSIPICKRVLELEPRNMAAIILLGWILWLDGEDDESKRILDVARSIDSAHIEVLLLDAALTSDRDKKIDLYRKVLEKEPTNTIAQGKLSELLC